MLRLFPGKNTRLVGATIRLDQDGERGSLLSCPLSQKRYRSSAGTEATAERRRQISITSRFCLDETERVYLLMHLEMKTHTLQRK